MVFRAADGIVVRTSPEFLDYSLRSLEEIGLIRFGAGSSEGPDGLMDCTITGEGRKFLRRLLMHPGRKDAPEYAVLKPKSAQNRALPASR